jgi:cysteine synthase A
MLSLPDLIGNTPLLKFDVGSINIWAKAEFMNPSGSIKDRPAHRIMNEAMKNGKLKRGDTLVEATSGNMGISFAMLCAYYGIRCVLIMPKNMSEERKNAFKAYGAKLIEVGDGDFDAAIKIRNEMAEKNDWFNGNQFHSEWNINAHIDGTGSELWNQLREQNVYLDGFIAGTGTGGTLMGVGHVFNTLSPKTKIVAVEPFESPVMSGGKKGQHGIQGIGDGSKFLVNLTKVDEIVLVKTHEAQMHSTTLASTKGLFIGFSACANLIAAERWAKTAGAKNVATVLCDRGDRYFSNIF